MTFPTGNSVTTDNLASGTGNPAAARTDLYTMAVYLNQIIAGAGAASGVALLDASGRINSSQMPMTITSPGNLTLTPNSGYVKLNSILRFQVIPRATLLTRTDMVIGDMALFADDLTGANAGVAMYDGTNWRILGVLSGASILS